MGFGIDRLRAGTETGTSVWRYVDWVNNVSDY